MIIHFSATGNNKYLATQIADRTNDYIVSMVELINNNECEIKLGENEQLGFVFPTYFWGLPRIVEDFLSSVQINVTSNNYVFTIASYGTSTGYALGYMKEYLEDMNINVDAQFEVKMADTWTVMFDLTDKNKIENLDKKVDIQLKKVIETIKSKEKHPKKLNFINKFSANIAQMMYDSQRKTKHLHVGDKCTKCGICVDGCPINAIEIQDNKVVWTKERCLMCLRCLHRCPEFSIQYDNKTQNHGQYTNRNIVEFD